MVICRWMVLLTCAGALPGYQAIAQDKALVDRVGPMGFVELRAPSFDKLEARQQALAYWLSQAAIAIDPIIYDQNSRWGLRQKRLLEGIVRSAPSDAALRRKLTDFTKLFWANRGNHNDQTAQKFLPEFSFEEFQRAAHAVLASGAFANAAYGLAPIRTAAELDRELDELRPSLFDAD